MKRSMMVALCLAVGVLGAAAVMAGEMGKTHQVTTEIVSVDMKAHMITIKDETGASKTVPVLEAARASMKDLKPGTKVTLTCQDDAKGQHEGISAILVATATHKG